jgi:DNA-binding HxlR family transcriptional regulator
MLKQRNAYTERAACPLYTAIAVIEGRWKPMLFQRLLEMPRGFGELQRAIPRVSTKVLREQLRQMLADDLITREELTPHHWHSGERLTLSGRQARAARLSSHLLIARNRDRTLRRSRILADGYRLA